MKYKFLSELSKFVSKHKYLVFVAIFLAFILLFRTRFVIEGLTTIGEYEFLAPVPPDNTISTDTVKKMVMMIFNAKDPTSEQIATWQNFYQKNLREKELQYYIDNGGKWPYDGYVLNYIKSRPDFFSNLPPAYSHLKNVDDMQKNLTNRSAYQLFIMPQESQMNPPPLSYQIYMGTAQPPSASSASTTNSTNASSSSSSSSVTDPNYQDFISLCKKVLNN